jgi:gamma-glutamyltranspeptidase/glutathione hydrolase
VQILLARCIVADIRSDHPQCPPNGQGLTALVALGIVEAVEIAHNIDLLDVDHNSAQYMHILIEALRWVLTSYMRKATDDWAGLRSLVCLPIRAIRGQTCLLSFPFLTDSKSTLYQLIYGTLTRLARYYVTDPDVEYVPVKELLSKVNTADLLEIRLLMQIQEYLAKRAALIDLNKAVIVKHGSPINSSDTVYLATADSEGNSCSFIASNYAGEYDGALHDDRAFLTLIPRNPGP